MSIDPKTPPPLPEQVTGRPVRRRDGTATQAVSIRDAARLMGWDEKQIQQKIDRGQVDICLHQETTYVLIDSLWTLVPEEERRAGL